MTERLFRSERAVLPDGVHPASLRVRGGAIVAVEPLGTDDGGAEVIDVGNLMILPGLVDTHVHVNEPGRTEWEGFETATRAAAAGGVTTLLDMPLNAIPATTTAGALAAKRAAAAGKCHVDVGFIGGVVPGNGDELAAMAESGVLAWKCFLVDSGVAEFAASDERVLRAALPALAAIGRPLMVHAELPGPIAQARREGMVASYAEYAATRPEAAEVDAVRLLTRLAGEYLAPIHVVHLSGRRATSDIAAARRAGVPISAETCPHYLTFCAADIPDGATEFKCAPPIRSAEHREALWEGLARGTIGSIASDHSPCPPSLKGRERGDFAAAWGGIASLQLGLPVIWTAALPRGFGAMEVARWMSSAPADLVGLKQKGRLAAGADADLVVWEPDATWRVDASLLEHRHPLTPYVGMPVTGRVRATYLRGEAVYPFTGSGGPPRGRLLAGPSGSPRLGTAGVQHPAAGGRGTPRA